MKISNGETGSVRELDDGTCLWFYPDGFHRSEKRDRSPRPGVTVKYP